MRTNQAKKTAYVAPGAHVIDGLAQAAARDLNAYDHFPDVADFFDGSSLDRFVEAYRADIRLYLRARGIDTRQLIDCY